MKEFPFDFGNEMLAGLSGRDCDTACAAFLMVCIAAASVEVKEMNWSEKKSGQCIVGRETRAAYCIIKAIARLRKTVV